MCSNENCEGYMGKIETFKNDIECPICKSTVKVSKNSYKNFFVIIDPSDAITDVINRYHEYYDDIVSNAKPNYGLIEDIVDAEVHKKFVSNLPEEAKNRYVSCLTNTDGVLPNLSSKADLWPIHICIIEIPVTARFRNIITVGLWFGKKATNADVFKAFC